MQRHTTNGRRAASQTSTQASELAQRLASVEQVLQAQQQRIAEQEQELGQLRAALTTAAADAASATETTEAAGAVALAPRLKPQSAGMQTSRRALLMAGGTVAAVAAFEVATSHAPTAQAHGASASHASKAALGGVPWQTGTVSADEETLVKPSGSGYGSNDILQVQIGTGTVYSPAPLKAAITAYDTTTNNIGLYASSSTGYGLYGVTDSGHGATGAGLSGTANTGVGVAGMSAAGIAISGNSTSGLGASFSGGQAPLALGLSGSAGAPTGGNHVAGEIFGDANGELWVCVSSGSPGAWTKLAHLAAGATRGGAINFLPVPIRVIDTRSGQNPAAPLPTTKTPLVSGQTYTFQITGTSVGGSSVPAGAVGIYANVTAVFPTYGGNLIFYPADQAQPQSSTLNYSQGAVVGNLAFTGLSATGAIKVFVNGPANTDVVVDIAGFIV